MVGRISELTADTNPADDDEVEVRDISAGAVDAANVKVTRQQFMGHIQWKNPVRVATTVNGALATAFENADTVDGIALVTGDRILLKNQTTGSENGIYTVNATGAPTRAVDFDSTLKVKGGVTVNVQEGTANKDSTWTLTNNGAITIGTTSLVFEPFMAGALRMIEKATPASPDVNQIELYAIARSNMAEVNSKNEHGLVEILAFRDRQRSRKPFYVGNGSDVAGGATDLLNWGLIIATPEGTVGNTGWDSTMGVSKNFLTAATLDTDSGVVSSAAMTQRDMDPDVTIKFRIVSSAVRRVWIGWVEADHMGSDSTAATHKFALRLSTAPAVTGFTIVHSDGTTETVEAQIQASDTAVHTIRLVADNANTRWGYSFDGAAIVWITTNIPGATQTMLLQVQIRTLEAVAKNFDMGFIWGENSV